MSLYAQCRLCADLKFSNELIHIKTEEAVQLNLEQKIQQCLNLHFNDTRLPKNVCSLCCDKVTASYDFQELVKEAQQRLEDAVEDSKSNIKEELSDTELNSYDYVEPLLKDDEDLKIKDDDSCEDDDDEKEEEPKPKSTDKKHKVEETRTRKRRKIESKNSAESKRKCTCSLL